MFGVRIEDPALYRKRILSSSKNIIITDVFEWYKWKYVGKSLNFIEPWSEDHSQNTVV